MPKKAGTTIAMNAARPMINQAAEPVIGVAQTFSPKTGAFGRYGN